MALGESSEPDVLDPEDDSPMIASWPPPVLLPTTSLKPAGKGILVNHDYRFVAKKNQFFTILTNSIAVLKIL